jgi:hypothetical protein
MDCGLTRQVGMTIGVRPFYNPLLSAALIFAEASEPRRAGDALRNPAA